MQNSIKSSAVSPTVKLRWNCFEVSVEMGDITQVHTDMILTTCDPIISCTNGVAKAIVEKGGERLQDAIDSRMVNEVRLHFGDVLVLNAESLNAWCVAFVCPSRGSFRDLKEAYYNALKEAMYLGAKTIAMPGFGTGPFMLIYSCYK
ncbi:unnamed protein product [Anisakis simplex]|uniref:Macro domain-containing protein n=1 Tax=Anisakis simplex TaxID=6269 RepID=A0A0M3JZB5_ANISI|nr:unnamed protein product [Anisakis simplex]